MLQAILREHFSAWFLRYAVSQSGHTATPPPIVAGKWGRTLWFDISCCNEIKMRTYGQNESTSNPDLMFECWCCLVASGLFIFCFFCEMFTFCSGFVCANYPILCLKTPPPSTVSLLLSCLCPPGFAVCPSIPSSWWCYGQSWKFNMLSSLANGFGWAMLEIGHPSDLSQEKSLRSPKPWFGTSCSQSVQTFRNVSLRFKVPEANVAAVQHCLNRTAQRTRYVANLLSKFSFDRNGYQHLSCATIAWCQILSFLTWSYVCALGIFHIILLRYAQIAGKHGTDHSDHGWSWL